MPATLHFTQNLARHLTCPEAAVAGGTLREALDEYFVSNPGARNYVLDDQGAVRKHVVMFVNQEPIGDRIGLSDVIDDGDEIFVIQALSGG